MLQGQPSRIEGTVRLLQYETAARLQGVDVALIDVRGDQRAVSPDGAGRFTVDNLGAGDYTLRFDAVGYEPVESAVTLGVGETLRQGALLLRHQSAGPNSVMFDGRVQRADARDHSGTTVSVYFASDDTLLASVQTDAVATSGCQQRRQEDIPSSD